MPIRFLPAGLVCLAALIAGPSSFGVIVVTDYKYDTSGFFGSGNPQGAAAGA
jgi:hypothetical protein